MDVDRACKFDQSLQEFLLILQLAAQYSKGICEITTEFVHDIYQLIDELLAFILSLQPQFLPH